jgi:hypothetical protein
MKEYKFEYYVTKRVLVTGKIKSDSKESAEIAIENQLFGGNQPLEEVQEDCMFVVEFDGANVKECE